VLRRLATRLRKRFPAFREERFLGRLAIRARAYAQLPLLGLRSPSLARLCLGLTPRYTMIAPRLLFAMHDLARDVARGQVPGDVVECGVWNGGSLAFLASATGGERDAWAFDSFEGLPEPSGEDPELVRSGWYPGWNVGREDLVRDAWRRCGLPPGRLHVVKGWFEETFPHADVPAIALLHIDADWYESVRLCLERWYDRVSPGGVVILNDWNLYGGADRAVAEFLARRAPGTVVQPLGRMGGYFVRRGSVPGAIRRG
jgi:O-methyltransferase